MQTSKPSMILIGLDGATFDVIQPLVKEGRLPNLGRIMKEGAYGTLNSIVPPITGPAWSVLATGKNPGRLGIFDFVNRRSPDDFQLYPIRSHDLAGQTYWDVLSDQGYRVGILNYPMLVPGYPVNGWMVAGLGASKMHDFTYPNELKDELDRVCNGYEITVSYGLPKYHNNLDLLIKDMNEGIRKRLDALEYLLKNYPVDFLAAVFTMSDVASHTLWEFWENGNSADPFTNELREEYIAIWEALDRAVGQVLGHLAPGGHALIVSDHGFGSSHGLFHVNYWLKEAGYLFPKSQRSGQGNRIREFLVEKTSPFLGPLYKKILGSSAHQFLRSSILREIDLERSRAFALENSDGYGAIYINRGYAHAHGTDPDQFVRETREKIKQELLALGQREGLQFQIFAADDLYTGEKKSLAPEVIFLVNDYRTSVSYRLEGPLYANRRHHPLKSGTHRLNGIFLATGPKVKRGEIHGAQLQDVAPTLLHLMDISERPYMDGKILSDILHEQYQPKHESAQTPVEVTSSSRKEAERGEDEDLEDVLQRLADLGYLD